MCTEGRPGAPPPIGKGQKSAWSSGTGSRRSRHRRRLIRHPLGCATAAPYQPEVGTSEQRVLSKPLNSAACNQHLPSLSPNIAVVAKDELVSPF
ncbi:hypothetical protein chiPu_0012818 [Chiloscyllium punctatum]|uniref:Uncharacterized protein n=1 Tax=Chiloscyllium punctatum TaxID=137246 RepID=A0A401SVC7_CHIPU|nr:hypothetical protein [Chiloscyllium punctatum]